MSPKSPPYAKVFVKWLKFVSILSFLAIFGFWSFKALSKYISKPVSSSVTYTFGDDGHGNISKLFLCTY